MNISIKKSFWSIAGIIITAILSGCDQDWLNIKPNQVLVVPNKIEDFRALLDNTSLMNTNHPGLGVISADNFYVTTETYQARTSQERNAYIWAETHGFFEEYSATDWQNAYSRILRCNIVIDGLKALGVQPLEKEYDSVFGTALFFRGLDFYGLSQLFCKAFRPSTATTDLGLPLRTSSDVNLAVKRSTLQHTYDRIISDMKHAALLLPVTSPSKARPTKSAAYGQLARIYLSMENYETAFLYADSCLQVDKKLMDYSDLPNASSYPFERFNDEVIFHCTMANYGIFRSRALIVDSLFYRSFADGDLRKTMFFTGGPDNISFKGSYDGSRSFFCGLATDEMYLIRAECNARKGQISDAMKDLNTLLRARWAKDTRGVSLYVNQTARSEDETLKKILDERRKELCFRDLRWGDLRRLNRDERFEKSLSRNINGNTYTLLPNSPRYVLPLDNNEILLGGLEQNER